MRMRARSMRIEGEGDGFGVFFCPFFCKLITYSLLLGLPLGLKVLGPWAHHTEEVGMRY